MRVLIVNPGSSTIKWAQYASLRSSVADSSGQLTIHDFEMALQQLIERQPSDLYIIRFVHGGNNFCDPVILTPDNLVSIEEISDLAPLHNFHSIACVKTLRRKLPKATIVGVFDTAFFHDLPKVSQIYGLPDALQQKYKLRRYGFHGFAHASMVDTWQSLKDVSISSKNRLITMQLGSGCSMAAIQNGNPIETSMGFTPNEGLLMSTRSGDIDAGLVTWLQRHEGWTVAETDQILNQQSGWLGISAESSNMADLLLSQSEKACLAVDVFCHRICKILGAYYALLGGLDGIVLSGGIAEHSLPLCRRLLSNLEHLGIQLSDVSDADNYRINNAPYCLTRKISDVSCWVVTGNEHQAMLNSVQRSNLSFPL